MADTATTTAPKDTATKAPIGTPMLPDDPNIHTYQFLNDNNYEIQLESLDEKNPFLDGRGFVLTDKPLLVVKVVKKEIKQ